ncbi:hypothetical protein QJS10_CPB21g01804 [Acorus calamus]|uniref:DUF4283 domain-containing protein n=1 Tax=Acorus calamus TaxID=4465 RepID=A0AAV9C457_ACOCL|nr:hypothetical protein QJS10_CPB21g01804 [Acorus calamus]
MEVGSLLGPSPSPHGGPASAGTEVPLMGSAVDLGGSPSSSAFQAGSRRPRVPSPPLGGTIESILMLSECSLSFVPPRVDETESVAVLNPSSYAPFIQLWDNAVIGYIIGKTPVYIPFVQFLRKLWKPKGDFSLLLHGNGFFTVKFNLAEDCNSILEGGPWTMEHRPFILKKWSPDVRMEQERLSSIPIWARIPNLPLHLWNSDCLSRIGNLIGTPLFMDSSTLRCSRTTFARLCIEVEAAKSLPDSIFVEISPGLKEQFRVEYDWKPRACQFWKTFGHDENRCCKKSSNSTLAPNLTLDPKPTLAKQLPPIHDSTVREEHPTCPAIVPQVPSVLKGKEMAMELPSRTTPSTSPQLAAKKLMSDAHKALSRLMYVPKKAITPVSNKFSALMEPESMKSLVGESSHSAPPNLHCPTMVPTALATLAKLPTSDKVSNESFSTVTQASPAMRPPYFLHCLLLDTQPSFLWPYLGSLARYSYGSDAR